MRIDNIKTIKVNGKYIEKRDLKKVEILNSGTLHYVYYYECSIPGVMVEREHFYHGDFEIVCMQVDPFDIEDFEKFYNIKMKAETNAR